MTSTIEMIDQAKTNETTPLNIGYSNSESLLWTIFEHSHDCPKYRGVQQLQTKAIWQLLLQKT